MARSIRLNKYVLLVALCKAAVAGAGASLAALASIDIAIAKFAKDAFDAWQVNDLINSFALIGAGAGFLLQAGKLFFFR